MYSRKKQYVHKRRQGRSKWNNVQKYTPRAYTTKHPLDGLPHGRSRLNFQVNIPGSTYDEFVNDFYIEQQFGRENLEDFDKQEFKKLVEHRYILDIQANGKLLFYNVASFLSFFRFISKLKGKKYKLYKVRDRNIFIFEEQRRFWQYRRLFKIEFVTNLIPLKMRDFYFSLLKKEGRIITIKAVNRIAAQDLACERENYTVDELFDRADWIYDTDTKKMYVIDGGRIMKEQVIQNFDPNKLIPKEIKLTKKMRDDLLNDFNDEI